MKRFLSALATSFWLRALIAAVSGTFIAAKGFAYCVVFYSLTVEQRATAPLLEFLEDFWFDALTLCAAGLVLPVWAVARSQSAHKAQVIVVYVLVFAATQVLGWLVAGIFGFLTFH